MKKILAGLLAACLLLAAAYAGGAWYIGKEVEAVIGEPYRQIEAMPYVKILKREYRRGVFTSEEKVTFELFGNIMRFLAESGRQAANRNPDSKQLPAEFLKPIRLTAISHIRHGPLSAGSSLVAAVVDTDLDVEERFKPALAKVIGERKIVNVHTIYRYDGSGDSVISSPAFTTEFASGKSGQPVKFSWKGVNATLNFTGDLASYALRGEAPGLEAADNTTRVVVSGIRVEADNRRVFEDEPLFVAGRQKFSIGEALAEGIADGGATLKQLSYEANTTVNDGFADIVARIGVQQAAFARQDYGPAHYDITIKHLHARTFAQLNRAMLDMYADPEAVAAGTRNPAAMMEPFVKPIQQLLERNPELLLDRVSFNTPHGAVLVSGHARLVDVKAEDFKEPAALMAKLDAQADLSLPESLVMAMLGMKSDPQEAMEAQLQRHRQQIAKLEEQGYAQRDGAVLHSRLAFRNGEFAVNDQPFNPAALASPLPAVKTAPPGRARAQPERERRQFQPSQ
ncbi:MAG TPA: YdgA family protein [Burkholderiales bacterium]|nr:YdgA family protein [Burkholderiales bacterium]